MIFLKDGTANHSFRQQMTGRHYQINSFFYNLAIFCVATTSDASCLPFGNSLEE
jgi:hypothetical protein